MAKPEAVNLRRHLSQPDGSRRRTQLTCRSPGYPVARAKIKRIADPQI